MDPTFIKGIIDFLNQTGVFGGTLLMVWLLYTERLVPASRLREQKEATKAAIASTQELSEGIKVLISTVGEVRIAIATIGVFDRPKLGLGGGG